jgi:hypothetical protein
MNTDFRISLKYSNGNLHIKPEGDFDGNSAWQLVNSMHANYSGHGRIYIDTNRLGEICPFGSQTFQCRLNKRRVPADCITFIGEKASVLAPEGCRVIPPPDLHTTCRCNGKCKICQCVQQERPAQTDIPNLPSYGFCRPADKRHITDGDP